MTHAHQGSNSQRHFGKHALAALFVFSTALGSPACGGESFTSAEEDTTSTADTTDGATGNTTSGSATSSGSGSGTTGGSSGSGSSGSGSSGSGTTGGTSGSGTSGSGTSGSTSAGTTGSGGASSVSSTTATSTTGSQPDLCQLPLVTGVCNAYFESWGFNTATGRCESFIYGGCEGNENRFETLEACLDACDPGGRTACQVPSDCGFDLGCCGISGEATLENLNPVNNKYNSSLAPACQLLDCASVRPEGIENFGLTCENNVCGAYDIRQSELSACTENTDCKLRNGLGCCEGCGEAGWVAISVAEEATLLKGCGEIGCPACAPIVPAGMTAACSETGHCQVLQAEL